MSNVAKPVKFIGLFSTVAGIILVLTGGIVWGAVITPQLAAEKIVVSKDAPSPLATTSTARSAPSPRPR